MLRLILASVLFSLVCGTISALAAQSCEDWCQNRCAHRVLSHAACINKCFPACQQKRGQDPRVRALPHSSGSFAIFAAIQKESGPALGAAEVDPRTRK